MLRIVPVLIAFLLLLGTGLVHGLWTERWRKSEAIEAAVARMRDLPVTIGDWTSEAIDMTNQELTMAGAEGWYVRRFHSPRTTQSLIVMLLCGKSKVMCAHRPENCYASAGYELVGDPVRYHLKDPSSRLLGEFWTGLFVKEDSVSSSQLRIFWSWLAGDQWQAPANPRWSFAGQPYLYKLYVLHDVNTRLLRLEDDLAVDFMRQFIPVLTERLNPATTKSAPTKTQS